MEKVIKVSEIEAYVDERLALMQKIPGMFGDAFGLECMCFQLLDLIEHFCHTDSRLDIQDEFQLLSKRLYKNRPGPFPLSHYLTDKEYGLGLGDREAENKVVEFFVELRSTTKEKQHVDQEKA